MEKDSALYQLMDVRMNGVMNDIVGSDGEYQEIIRRSDEYSSKLEKIGLPVDIRVRPQSTGQDGKAATALPNLDKFPSKLPVF